MDMMSSYAAKATIQHILAYQIFAPAEQFLTNIQAVDITVQEAMKGAGLVVSHLKSLRTDVLSSIL